MKQLLALTLLAGVLPLSAHAATATATINVTATALDACSVTALPLPFGNYSAAQLDATTTVTVLCTLGTAYSLGLDAGIGPAASVAVRHMIGTLNTTATLDYALYTDAGRTVLWGNTPGINTYSSTGLGVLELLTVYGRVPGNQYVTPDAYTDTVTVTLGY